MLRDFLIILLAAFLILAETSEPTMLSEEEVRVVDGDTLVVKSEGRSTYVRLAEVDAPELDQPYGLEAKAFLAQQVEGKDVVILCRGRDRYRRFLCHLEVEDQDINLLLVRQGLAWGKGNYAAEMQRARQLRLGLWQQDDPIPPERWRKRKKN